MSPDSHQSRNRQRESVALRAALAGATLLLGIAQTWANRYSIWSDLMSYIEAGETSIVQGRWNESLSGHWSPLFSWILGLMLAVVRPSLENELVTIKAVQLLIYVFNVFAFDALIRESLKCPREEDATSSEKSLALGETALICAAYVSFAWASLRWLVVYRETPDLLVAGLVYLATAYSLRGIRTGKLRDATILGGLLGLAYLAKTVMFPLAFSFLGARLIVERTRRACVLACVACLVFAGVSAPYAIALSLKLGRPTIGEAGRLAYAMMVSPGSPAVHWQGQPEGSGHPVHPTRRVSVAPDVFEFATPILGTYPPWFDPVYWNEGMVTRLNMRRQLLMMRQNVQYCLELFGAPLLVLAVAAALGGRQRASLAALAARVPVLLPGLVGLLTFVVATWLRVERPPWGPLPTRYIGPFVVLILLGALGSLRVADSRAARTILATLVAVACLAAGMRLFWVIGNDVAAARSNPPVHLQWQAAQALRQFGVAPGSRVAVVGGDSFYWARLARVSIVAESKIDFWKANDDARQRALEAMSLTGARVVVSTPKRRGARRPRPGVLAAMGWIRLGTTEHFVLSLNRERRQKVAESSP